MTERKTIYKCFWVWNFEKEERWLNEMAMNGWVLVEVGWCRYIFEKGEPGAYTIRLEMRGAAEGYIDFMRDTGAEYIGRCFQWLYFRKRTEDGSFDLFSDIDSRVAHLDRIGKMLFIFGMLNLVLGVMNAAIGSGANSATSILNLLVCTLLMYGLGRIRGKKEELEKERQLHE